MDGTRLPSPPLAQDSTMNLPDRLPHALALVVPFTLALAGDPARPRAALQPVADDTLVAWRIAGRSPNARAWRDTTEKHGGSASGHLAASAPTTDIVNSGDRGGGGSHGGSRGGGRPVARPVRFEQTLNAIPFRERRVRVSLWVRTKLPDKPAKDTPVSQVNAFVQVDNEDATISIYDGSV